MANVSTCNYKHIHEEISLIPLMVHRTAHVSTCNYKRIHVEISLIPLMVHRTAHVSTCNYKRIHEEISLIPLMVHRTANVSTCNYKHIHVGSWDMSNVMRKPAFCICELANLGRGPRAFQIGKINAVNH